jgi:hypothetical protein
MSENGPDSPQNVLNTVTGPASIKLEDGKEVQLAPKWAEFYRNFVEGIL